MSKELLDLMAEQGRAALDNDSVYNEYLKLDPSKKRLADLMAEQGRAALDNDSVYNEYLNSPSPISQDIPSQRIPKTSELIYPRLAEHPDNRFVNMTKDLLSFPGRTAYALGKSGSGIVSDFIGGNWDDIGSRAAETYVQEMTDVTPEGLVETVVKSPSTIPLMAIGGIPTAKGTLGAFGSGLGRAALAGGTVLGDIYTDKLTNNEPTSLSKEDYGAALLAGIAPEALRGAIGAIASPIVRAGNVPKMVTQGIVEESAEEAAQRYADQLARRLVKPIETIRSQPLGMSGAIIGSLLPEARAFGAVAGAAGGKGIQYGLGKAAEYILKHPEVAEPIIETAKQSPKVLSPLVSGLASFVTKPSIDQRSAKYNEDVYKAYMDKKLTETEYNAYKNPNNATRFYERFREYK